MANGRPPSATDVGVRELARLPSQGTVAVATDGAFVYFTARDSSANRGSVVKTPVGGGASIVLAEVEDPYAIAVDGESVYFTSYSDGAVSKVSKLGGAITVLTTADTSSSSAAGLAIDDTDVYFTSTSGIFRVSKAGGKTTLFAEDTNGADAIVADATNVYWLGRGTTSELIGNVRKASKTTGAIETLGTAPLFREGSTWSLAQDDDSLYLPDRRGGKVYRLAKSNGDVHLVTASAGHPFSLASDGTYVYWTDVGVDPSTGVEPEPLVRKALVGGGTPVRIASTLHTGAYAIAVDKTNVYWTNYVSTGSVYAAAK
ncbi:MAG: putative secreted protein [Myxococcaceae bacterium]|nr:putative secreted protein [Myxococcaceae bacterium]